MIATVNCTIPNSDQFKKGLKHNILSIVSSTAGEFLHHTRFPQKRFYVLANLFLLRNIYFAFEMTVIVKGNVCRQDS